MIDLLIEDGVFEVSAPTDPFLGFPGEMFLVVDDVEVVGYSEEPEFLLAILIIEANDMTVESSAGDVEIVLSSSDFEMSDLVIDTLGSSPEMRPGSLPAGLVFNASNPPIIAGTPLQGTEGLYEVTLHATNGIEPDDAKTITIRIR